jgi:tRNA-specific 2-thiouridylase
MGKEVKTVFVGVSGGVDSSVSALLLKNQGYNVVGVFIRTWTPDFIECTWRDERRDAMRVCAYLKIPFLECDAEEEYKKGVADYMIEEYKNGNTPNPDVMCNRMVKFGVFWKFAKEHGADFIATGHYAVNLFSPCQGGVPKGRGGRPLWSSDHLPLAGEEKCVREKLFLLKQNKDKSKDQSYFLWTLNQDDLSHILFPIGHFKKTEVRKIAKKYKLPTALKKDSQGVCFLGPLDMKDFLKHYIKSEKGNVLDVEGKIIGTHEGAIFFTKGERHGFNITSKTEKDKPYYVLKKDIINNTITVGVKLTEENIYRNKIINIIKTNWINGVPKKDEDYKAQIRYHGELLNCKISSIGLNCAEIIFDKNILVDSGQSIVVYDGDICLGGGVVN